MGLMFFKFFGPLGQVDFFYLRRACEVLHDLSLEVKPGDSRLRWLDFLECGNQTTCEVSTVHVVLVLSLRRWLPLSAALALGH